MQFKTLTVLLLTSLLSFSLLTKLYAAGGIAHMYMAHEAIKQIPNSTLRNILKDNLDVYLVGAYYPDSGYVKGTHYGEDSHWDPFIFAFADYIKTHYPNPTAQRQKLIAFLFGCASHRVSDEIFHRHFLSIVAEKDFKNDRNRAHSYGDPGIDLLATVDKFQWFTFPAKWWIPINDLLQIYKNMGLTKYTRAEIEKGTSTIYLAGVLERLIAPAGYPYLRYKMPWTAHNYMDYPTSGLRSTIEQIAQYDMALWTRLTSVGVTTDTPRYPKMKSHSQNEPHSKSTEAAEGILAAHFVSVPHNENKDGSIEIKSPVIEHWLKYHTAISEFLSQLLRGIA